MTKNKAVPLLGPPKGCNSGNLCVYNAGNGGDLCFQTNKQEGNFPDPCLNSNEGEYNRNGNAVFLMGIVTIPNKYLLCYYTLYSGHYLLYNAKDRFQSGDPGCTNYTLEHNLFRWSFFHGPR